MLDQHEKVVSRRSKIRSLTLHAILTTIASLFQRQLSEKRETETSAIIPVA